MMKAGILFLFMILEKNISIFQHWVWLSLRVLSYMVFIMLRYLPPVPSFMSIFILKGCWNMSNPFSTSIEIITWIHFFFFPASVHVVCYTAWFLCMESSFDSRNKSHFVMYIKSLICYWIHFSNILLRIFISIYKKY